MSPTAVHRQATGNPVTELLPTQPADRLIGP